VTAPVDREPIAGFKDLGIDAVDIEQAARFWSAALGLEVEGPATSSS
jgi:hypothetical protein